MSLCTSHHDWIVNEVNEQHYLECAQCGKVDREWSCDCGDCPEGDTVQEPDWDLLAKEGDL